jgi:pimeloyl-ACP methyl ester carboxylesterase
MKITRWEGYDQVVFELEGREGFLVLPEVFAEGRPWIWRAEFFGCFDYADRALLREGYVLAYYGLSNMYGSPAAVEGMKGFQDFVTRLFGLAEKAALFGFSRGGLYAFNYAATYPERVSLLYLDAPVLDIQSWPGGQGEGVGAENEWQECLAAYGLTEEDARTAKVSPLDRVEAVAAARIPILVVAGDSDDVVPLAENAAILEKRYRKLGGALKMIVKPGIGHHPHSLEQPEEIVDFIREHTSID